MRVRGGETPFLRGPVSPRSSRTPSTCCQFRWRFNTWRLQPTRSSTHQRWAQGTPGSQRPVCPALLPPPGHASPDTAPHRLSSWQRARPGQYGLVAQWPLPGPRRGGFGKPLLAGTQAPWSCYRGGRLPTLPLNLESPLICPQAVQENGTEACPLRSQPTASRIPEQWPPGWRGRGSRRRRRLQPGRGGRGGASISAEERVIGSGDSESQGSRARALPTPAPQAPGMVSEASVAHFGYLSRYTIPPARPREGGAARLRPLAALMQPVLS